MWCVLLVLICFASASPWQKRDQLLYRHEVPKATNFHSSSALKHIHSSLKVLTSMLLAFNPTVQHCCRLTTNFVGAGWSSSRNFRLPAGVLLAPLHHVQISMLGADVLDFDKVVEAMKIHAPNILHKEPNWNMFAEDFKVFDHSGAELKGLIPNKLSLKMLRKKREELEVEDDVNVTFILHDEFSTTHRFPLIEAHWKVRLRFPADSPLDVEAETVFHLNDKSQADFLRIDKWLVNGNPAAHFKDWIQEVEEFQLVNPTALEAIENETLAAYWDMQAAGSEFSVANMLNPNSAVSSQVAEVAKSLEANSEAPAGSNVTVLDDLPRPDSQGPVLFFGDELCVGHDTGLDHPESSSRLRQLLDRIQKNWSAEFGQSSLRVWEPPPGVSPDVTEEQLLRVHSQNHVDKMKLCFQMAKEQNATQYLEAGQTVVSAGSQAAAMRAAGLVISAVDNVLHPSTTSSRAFVAARPPGHHAERNTAMGFCLFNNIMVGVAHAEAVHAKSRIAILDFDVHPGNGNEDIVRGHSTRFYASSHQSPVYPRKRIARGRFGKYNEILNVPLPPGSGSEDFRLAWSQTILPAVVEFKPDMVFIAAGFDAHQDDPLAQLNLKEIDFEWITEAILRAARGAPVVSVLEGGYDIDALQRCVHAHLEALAGKKF